MISSLARAICARGWFLDTRANVNVCGQRDSFHTYHPIPPGTIFFCADSHRAEVQGRGDVRLMLTHGEWVTLRDVLHVPTISKGFVSTAKFTKFGSRMSLRKAGL
uniref:Retrovirus-related Pol polyprotein from transposon TNT 1-94-like beta-barrel domain-containing protein n=1 Tax=Lactuca sativa TaxID=4236 RepID=A0A9R1X6Z7_LACSA|nr:hypothetical protein LSAT_V11C700349460 [Lactuca sativa]